MKPKKILIWPAEKEIREAMIKGSTLWWSREFGNWELLYAEKEDVFDRTLKTTIEYSVAMVKVFDHSISPIDREIILQGERRFFDNSGGKHGILWNLNCGELTAVDCTPHERPMVMRAKWDAIEKLTAWNETIYYPWALSPRAVKFLYELEGNPEARDILEYKLFGKILSKDGFKKVETEVVKKEHMEETSICPNCGGRGLDLLPCHICGGAGKV